MAESHAEAHARSGRALQCVVVTPESTVLDEQVDFVALPLYDGELGIAPGHSPLIGRLGYGELRLGHADHAKRFYVDGGFVQVVDNVVSVLTNRALPVSAIDMQVAAEHLAAARARKADSEESPAVRERLERQARAQLHIVQKGQTTHAGH